MPNFRLHQKKHLRKKNKKKRKHGNFGVSQGNKRRKISYEEEEKILDPKVFSREIGGGDQMVVIPGKKYVNKKVVKKRRKLRKISKSKIKKLAQLRKKRKDKKESEEYFSLLRSSAKESEDLGLKKVLLPTSHMKLTSKQHVERIKTLKRYDLEVDDNEFLKKIKRKERENVKDEAFDELYYQRKKKETIVISDEEEDEEEDDEEEEEGDGTTFNLQFNFENVEEEEDLIPEKKKLVPLPEEEREKFEHESISDLMGEGGLFEDSPRKVKYTKFYRIVNRKPEIDEQRSMLPIYSMEQEIMEKIYNEEVLIVCGETGSGKTTQVPQFCYEGGFGFKESGNPGMICVTQPRRVAAVSTAKRVAEEMNVKFGRTVGVQIRYFRKLHQTTKIKFMTDGILLKEIQGDVLLLKYSIIILDEAHERNVNTDILIGWLARILPLRNKKAKNRDCTPAGQLITPLRLVIMSATLRVSDFTENKKLFPVPPSVINVRSRQFPVTLHFNKKTSLTNYLVEAKVKAIKIHENLPQGGILIFLTGKKEIDWLVKELKDYSRKNQKERRKIISEMKALKKELAVRANISLEEEDNSIDETKNTENVELLQEKVKMEEELINKLGDLEDDDENQKNEDTLFDGFVDDEIFDNELNFLEESILPINQFTTVKPVEQVLFTDRIKSKETILEGIQELEKQNNSLVDNLYVLPLYSKLNPSEQFKVFKKPPKGCRLCVVATNVAETSITIPNIRYVIDPGREKVKKYEKSTGAMKFVINWVPQSSANQRAGRAGRTCPGHCYRLFSSAVYEQKFQLFSEPDISQTPVDNVVLQMKAMDINNILNFPFPTQPDIRNLERAIKSLIHIQALKPIEGEGKSGLEIDTVITPLGAKINEFPIHPRYGKMLLLAKKTDCLDYVITIVSCLSVGEIFMNENNMSTEERTKWNVGNSDLLCMLKVVGGYLFCGGKDAYCKKNALRIKAMREIRKLNGQLSEILVETDSTLKPFQKPMSPPSDKQRLMIRQIICAGFVDQFAKIVENLNEINKLNIKEVITPRTRPYITFLLGDSIPAYIHPSSFMYGRGTKYIVYKELQKNGNKYYMKGITSINEKWLTALGNLNCC